MSSFIKSGTSRFWFVLLFSKAIAFNIFPSKKINKDKYVVTIKNLIGNSIKRIAPIFWEISELID